MHCRLEIRGRRPLWGRGEAYLQSRQPRVRCGWPARGCNFWPLYRGAICLNASVYSLKLLTFATLGSTYGSLIRFSIFGCPESLRKISERFSQRFAVLRLCQHLFRCMQSCMQFDSVRFSSVWFDSAIGWARLASLFAAAKQR